MTSKKTKSKLAQAALGTATSMFVLAEQFNINPDDIEEILLDMNIERCPECGWWVESGELSDKDGEEQSCESCRS